jgi:hypothetical protein
MTAIFPEKEAVLGHVVASQNVGNAKSGAKRPEKSANTIWAVISYPAFPKGMVGSITYRDVA